VVGRGSPPRTGPGTSPAASPAPSQRQSSSGRAVPPTAARSASPSAAVTAARRPRRGLPVRPVPSAWVRCRGRRGSAAVAVAGAAAAAPPGRARNLSTTPTPCHSGRWPPSSPPRQGPRHRALQQPGRIALVWWLRLGPRHGSSGGCPWDRRSRSARRRRPAPSTGRSRPSPCPPGCAVLMMPRRARSGRRDPWASLTTCRRVERVLGAVPWGRSTGRSARRSMRPTLSLLLVAHQSPNHVVADSPCGWRPASRRPTDRSPTARPGTIRRRPATQPGNRAHPAAIHTARR